MCFWILKRGANLVKCELFQKKEEPHYSEHKKTMETLMLRGKNENESGRRHRESPTKKI